MRVRATRRVLQPHGLMRPQRWAPLPARYWNVCRYFADKKKTTQKFEKTAESTAKALKAAERKAQQTLKQAGPRAACLPHLHRDWARPSRIFTGTSPLL
jgi:hypothetical protein